MTGLELIFQKCKAAHYKPWREEDLEECKALLQNLTKDELRMLNQSRWMSKTNLLYPSLFAMLYKDDLENINKQKESEAKETENSN